MKSFYHPFSFSLLFITIVSIFLACRKEEPTLSLAANGIMTVLTTSIFDLSGISMDGKKNIIISSQTENNIYKLVWE